MKYISADFVLWLMQVQSGFEKAGLHGNAFRCIPVFCVYLSILMHTYNLMRQQVCCLLTDHHSG